MKTFDKDFLKDIREVIRKHKGKLFTYEDYESENYTGSTLCLRDKDGNEIEVQELLND